MADNGDVIELYNDENLPVHTIDPGNPWIWLVSESGVWGLCCCVIGTLMLASWRSLKVRTTAEDPAPMEIGASTALIYPFMASGMLLLMFYFFTSLSFIMAIFCLIATAVSIVFTLFPVYDHFFPKLRAINLMRLGDEDQIRALDISLWTTAIALIVGWLFTGNWILNNILGMSLSVMAISLMRISNLRVITILFTCLFLYDIFWVFYSELFFGENVMVEVANKKATNPLQTVSQQFDIALPVIDMLDLPVKLVWGKMMIGLGDIVVPGVLLVFTLKYDKQQGIAPLRGYYAGTFCGYGLGLVTTIIMVVNFRVAQPALLYLVPCTLLPVYAEAVMRKQVNHIWSKGISRFLQSPTPLPFINPEPPLSSSRHV